MIAWDEFKTMAIEALREVQETDEVTLGDDEDFVQHGLDSLDRVNFLVQLESSLGKDLGEVDLTKVNTLKKLHAHVVEKSAA